MRTLAVVCLAMLCTGAMADEFAKDARIASQVIEVCNLKADEASLIIALEGQKVRVENGSLKLADKVLSCDEIVDHFGAAGDIVPDVVSREEEPDRILSGAIPVRTVRVGPDGRILPDEGQPAPERFGD